MSQDPGLSDVARTLALGTDTLMNLDKILPPSGSRLPCSEKVRDNTSSWDGVTAPDFISQLKTEN